MTEILLFYCKGTCRSAVVTVFFDKAAGLGEVGLRRALMSMPITVPLSNAINKFYNRSIDPKRL